jgi:hypothetical protein
VVYRWQMGTHDSALVLREVYPYLRTKRRQAALIWTLFTTLRHQNGHARTPAVVVAKRREIAGMVRALNAGREVELPTWVEEPPAATEPGWYLRNAIVWAKPNAMPESVTDRLSTRYELVFLLTKSRRYWFDLDAIRDDYSERVISAQKYAGRDIPARISAPDRNDNDQARGNLGFGHNGMNPAGRNPGDVWTVPTAPFAAAHFAVMPLALAERCILAGCKPSGTVLDPFSGSGTTGLAATRHGRRYVGIDLSANYLDLSLRTRLAQGALIPDGEVAS